MLAPPTWPTNYRGSQATTALGCGIMAIGVFLSSFAPNLAVFMLCYSFLFGAGVGLAYTAPMVNGWKWFPDKKGLVSGAVVAGFGAGGFVFNQVRKWPGLAWGQPSRRDSLCAAGSRN